MDFKVSNRVVSLGDGLALPVEYPGSLDLRETERAIKFIKDLFETELAHALNLTRVSAPLFVAAGTGVNDHLSGVERPVSFRVRTLDQQAEIVQSLAKWKRMALADYGFGHGEGLYTDMNAIRPDETTDNLHSIYVDQWDWERVISVEERNVAFLQWIVDRIYGVIVRMEHAVCEEFPMLDGPYLPERITYVHSEDLERRHPDLSPREREQAICREEGAVFVIGIGAPLASGAPHDARAADYDDWWTHTQDGKQGLNGDIIVWYPLLDCALELSSMGIRVNRESLRAQLEIKGELAKLDLPFHRRLMQDELPLTIGGGIGQSRLCMALMRRAHVGEVQAGLWPQEVIEVCRERGVFLL